MPTTSLQNVTEDGGWNTSASLLGSSLTTQAITPTEGETVRDARLDSDRRGRRPASHVTWGFRMGIAEVKVVLLTKEV